MTSNVFLGATVSGLVQGLIATLVMDVVAIWLMKRGLINIAPYGPVPTLLGRWILGFRKGRWVHQDLLHAAAESSEVRIGWIAHYVIGAVLGIVFASFASLATVSPASRPWLALAFGLSTCVLPWCLMFPAIGYGWFAHRIPITPRLLLSSLLNHVVFGFGLAVAGVFLAV